MRHLYQTIPQIHDIINTYKEKYSELSTEDIKMIATDVLDEIRRDIQTGVLTELTEEDVYEDIEIALSSYDKYNLKKIINGTGVILNTNLGRSPLPKRSIDRMVDVSTGYSNLECDLTTGSRGKRDAHVEKLLTELTGAEAAVVVNNNAAAVFLILSALFMDKEVLISRGELVEIGGSFRIPDIMTSAGVVLREVGTTNITRLSDYEANIGEDTAGILKVHPSNFAIIGHTDGVTVRDLKCLDDVILVEDLGSGSLIDYSRFGLSYERTVQDSVNDGADLVSFSGDKLLGGPQCGVIVGKKYLVEKIKSHPLMRVLRVDKLIYSSLEGLLSIYKDQEYLDQIPIIKMLNCDLTTLESRAETLKNTLEDTGASVEIIPLQGLVGGGAYPEEYIDSYGIIIKDESPEKLHSFLRSYKYPIVGSIQDGSYRLDIRTIYDSDFETIRKGLMSYYEL